jgi:small subunit ribosomal protein S1
MAQEQAEAVQASPLGAGNGAGAEETLPDGHGGLITRTAPSTSGGTYAGGTIVENDVGDSQEELMAAIEATIKPFEEGDLVQGSVVKIEKDEVLLDIGYKSEGVIPLRELSIRNDVDPSEVVSIGEELEALVMQKEDADGRLILSKKRAQYERAWGNIEDKKKKDETVTGPVIEVVKGGLILDIGLRGFLPASLVEMRRVRDLQPYVGKELECRIIELDKNRNNVVLSRRKFLEESQAEQRHEFLDSLQKGERRKGVVSSIVNFGAFVDLGGVDGLVHVSELSWKHVDHPSEVVEVGQEVEIEVLDVDLERERVSLSLKATQEDPWRQFARQHSVGDVIEGRVTKLVPFGAFVEVDDAIEGLVHISELADHHVERAEDEVSVHDQVPIKIIDIDLERRRISLSRKQALAPDDENSAIPDIERGVREAAPAHADIDLEREDSGGSEEDPVPALPDAVGVDSEEATEEIGTEQAPESALEQASEVGTEQAPNLVTEQAPDMGTAPGPELEEIIAEEPAADLAEGKGALAPGKEESAEEGEAGSDQSIEAIVQDLKRERGQS